MVDPVEHAIMNDVDTHENGCWTWSKPRYEVNIIRLLAEMLGQPLPAGVNLYRMPECRLGAQCVHPRHVGTHAEWLARKERLRIT